MEPGIPDVCHDQTVYSFSLPPAYSLAVLEVNVKIFTEMQEEYFLLKPYEQVHTKAAQHITVVIYLYIIRTK